MKASRSYLLIGVTTLLLLGLMVNQVIYVFNAADDQEKAFNEKIDIAFEIIKTKISANTAVCNSVSNCLFRDNLQTCHKALSAEEEWESVDAIIKTELSRFDLDLNYNFDFYKDHPIGGQNPKKHTYTKKMDKVFQEAGVIMYLEFPDKSMFLIRQIGSVFISSILLILFITVVFVITFRFYNRERRMAQTTKDMLNNMMHEFKTPIANISFANNAIERQGEQVSTEKIKKYTQIIRAENERLLENCEDILEYSKLENGLSAQDFESIDVHEVLHQLQNTYLIAAEEKGVKIRLEASAEKSLVKGKYSFLYNALSNIIDNAIRYCEKTPEIKIQTKTKDKYIEITIADNGIGIHKDDIKYIFDKFYRVSTGDRHDTDGFGLGLSYVKMVVNQMSGNISLKSEFGKGSVFTIKLPLSDE